MSKVDWREQFEVLTGEAEQYLIAHAKDGAHDIGKCSDAQIGQGGAEWNCRRFAHALELCRQVLTKHR